MSEKLERELGSIRVSVFFMNAALFGILGCLMGSHTPSKRQIYAGQMAAAMITYGIEPREAAARSWDVADVMIAREKPAEAPK